MAWMTASTGPPLIGGGEKEVKPLPLRAPVGFNGSAADRRRRVATYTQNHGWILLQRVRR